MRVHRSAHGRNFTVLPNALLQDRRLSYTARGLLVDLLSRPDGRREDGRQMADSSTQGRGTVRRALKELTAAGYYRVDTVRLPNGTVRSEAHVFDTPQQQRAAPGVARPGAGEPGTDRTDTPSVEESGKAPSHPDRPDDEARAAADTLLRVVRTEPRLWLGEAEALALAPLVARWLERGCTASELARAMLDGLPGTVHSPVAVLRSRLERKMPPHRVPGQRPAARYAECDRCHDPVPQRGICRACAGLGGGRALAVGGGATVARKGAARARAAMCRGSLTAGLLSLSVARPLTER
ncbi:hypothetical protein F4556_000425 [Kitasatospora gansuensis]|uniref:Helix-turn-helix domain-containing protein n=1 Tax=Kitasatospora gansuensis TaxID=258050 RepID=A0A7W7S6Q0_9ACTN|nr:hypothetical protein [Kitasatospora gansuensis]MBB4944890.1 hypothetical protein [Kitasatospora gansuensis]